MKKHILFPILLAGVTLFSAGTVKAQEDVNPLLKYINKDNGLEASVGGRMFADVAYFHSDWTPMKSGASITDARIHAALTYGKLYLYADFGFGNGVFSQKNLFVRYNFKESLKGIHSVKAGYYNEPSSMSMMTSSYNYHFITRPTVAQALAPGRALGATYKFYSQHFFADQGIFAQLKYNEQKEGYQGLSLSGRWLWKPVNNENMTIQLGSGLRYERINGGELYQAGVYKTNMHIASNMQTYVDATTQFLSCDLPWAKNAFTLNPEFLVKTNRFFARGEFTWKKVWKERDDQTLFESQLGGQQSWTDLKGWQGGNKLRPTILNGGYVEMGYLIFGKSYTYDDEYALLKGMGDKNSLEVVARYSCTDLTDITKGDRFLIGNHKFYPDKNGDGQGDIVDYPYSSSIDGGKLHAVTLGLNYSFNQYVKIMGEYQYANLSNVYFPDDQNFHQLQLRVMFAF